MAWTAQMLRCLELCLFRVVLQPRQRMLSRCMKPGARPTAAVAAQTGRLWRQGQMGNAGLVAPRHSPDTVQGVLAPQAERLKGSARAILLWGPEDPVVGQPPVQRLAAWRAVPGALAGHLAGLCRRLGSCHRRGGHCTECLHHEESVRLPALLKLALKRVTGSPEQEGKSTW